MSTFMPRITPFGMAALLAILPGCEKAGGEMDWARAALERNPRMEIVATDEAAGTFTVRDRQSGELRVVRVDEISAAPPAAAAASATANANTQAPEQAAAADAPAALPVSDAEPREPVQALDAEPAEPAAAAGQGRVISSGPGYTIKAADNAAAAERSAAPPAAPASTAAGATERRYEPLVCQGSRFMRIDGRSISFEGDGVRAEEGCEIYITNSQITASGVGVIARAANVHIKNSTVTGEGGALQASENAQVYAQSSRFRGMVRRLDDAVVHDSGDNVWN